MICPRCTEDKDLNEFGFHRYRKSGRSSTCKKCNRDRTNECRKRIAVMRRKEFVLSPHDRVMRAIRRGHRTREQIRRSARLHWDQTMDLIAEGIDKGVLGYKRVNDEPVFYERKVA